MQIISPELERKLKQYETPEPDEGKGAKAEVVEDFLAGLDRIFEEGELKCK